jgi:hypothetical protein
MSIQQILLNKSTAHLNSQKSTDNTPSPIENGSQEESLADVLKKSKN